LAAANTAGLQNNLGDTLVLVLDKNDLGALRMSDVDRNIIVATTDMPGLNKDPIKPVSTRLGYMGRESKLPEERSPHYSLAGKGDWLWGTKYVYSDDLMANELVRLNVEQ
jgi:hypothetical protein